MRRPYGYAILRGAIARNLVMHGLEPCIGLHHRSELNNFNLADDMIEPFRPLVDLYVAEHFDENSDELTSRDKSALFTITNYLVRQGGKRHRMMTAVGRTCSSLVGCIREQEKMLEFPELLELELHRYE